MLQLSTGIDAQHCDNRLYEPQEGYPSQRVLRGRDLAAGSLEQVAQAWVDRASAATN